MGTLHSIYQARVDGFTLSRKRYTKQLRISGIVRLLSFLLVAIGIYFYWANWEVVSAIAVVGLISFLFLVTRHENLKSRRDYYQQLIEINELEIKIDNGNYLDRPDGSIFMDDDHDYSRDIDLFGKGSFFQYINRTALKEGEQLLANRLCANDTQDIEQRQQAIKELSKKLDYRQEFEATARLLEDTSDPKEIINWSSNYNTFVPHIFSWLCYAQLLLSVVVIALYAVDLITGYWVAGVFFIGLAITGKYLGKVTALSGDVSKLEGFFTQYGKLLSIVEHTQFDAALLLECKKAIIIEGETASKRLQKLGKAIGRLEQRNNILFGIVANGFGLWDLKQAHTLEQWLITNQADIKQWLHTIAQLDALHSLANFAYNHPDYQYPNLSTGAFHLKLEQAIHPLLNVEKPVGNTIEINAGSFFIITGANMAGKSTFLRTVSMSIVMSNVGLPVRATAASYAPIKLITSMRTSDSLKDDESYFFSELKRLKFIVDKMENEPYFIVLDEILKGTNSIDKASGSRKLIEKLTRNNATGIIATHDLSLTEVAADYPLISNFYFDAQIIDEELFFDYTFKNGVATNMNASFLLKKMGIV